jgi:hypothetical protein
MLLYQKAVDPGWLDGLMDVFLASKAKVRSWSRASTFTSPCHTTFRRAKTALILFPSGSTKEHRFFVSIGISRHTT